MKTRLLGVFIIFAATLYVQGVVLPWAIVNSDIPLWADCCLLALIFFTWVITIERTYSKFKAKFKDDKLNALKKRPSK